MSILTTRGCLILATVLVTGCGGGSDEASVTPDEFTGDGGGGAAGGGEETAEAGPMIPTEGDPDDHHLGHGDLFAGLQPYVHGTVYVEPVVEVEPAAATGEGTFAMVRTGEQMQTAHFWHTHKADPDEIRVGVIALVSERKDAEGRYAAPETVEQAYDHRWWLARIVSVAPLETKGYVWVAGGYEVAPDAIRILEGDDSPALDVPGDEDAHFVSTGLWVAGIQPLPDKGTVYASLCAEVAPFDGGEGRFLDLSNGKIFDTAHAWKTRIAKPKQIQKGVHVLVPDIKDRAVYRAPQTREEALFNRWWFVKVEKKKKGTVVVEGSYEVDMDALRIVE